MTNLKKLVAFNMRQNRRRLGISQSALAEKAEASTQYIAMIELGRKFPSVEMLERLALALEVDSLDLFSPPPLQKEALQRLQAAVLSDLEKAVAKSVVKAVRKTVASVITAHAMELKSDV